MKKCESCGKEVFRKCRKSSSYGINYGAIIEHLGPCPEDGKTYNIDHIIPLAAFNFDDDFEIWAAFRPENHQWLLAKDNFKKHAKYNVEEFQIYLNNLKNEYESITNG